jgi:hypothetical protein
VPLRKLPNLPISMSTSSGPPDPLTKEAARLSCIWAYSITDGSMAIGRSGFSAFHASARFCHHSAWRSTNVQKVKCVASAAGEVAGEVAGDEPGEALVAGGADAVPVGVVLVPQAVAISAMAASKTRCLRWPIRPS